MNASCSSYRRFFPVFIAILVVVSACSSGKKEAPAPRPVPVIVGEVTQKNIPVQLRAIGNVQAYSTVSVKSLVEGEIIRIHFKEGQDVRRGDLLFSIDPKPSEAEVKQAEANLERDLTQVKQAEANLARDLA